MKRSALVLSLLVLTFGLARAQSSPPPDEGGTAAAQKAWLSLKFGLSCGRLTGVDEELGRQGGLAAGLMVTIRLSDRWSLSPEITPTLPKGASGIPFVTTGDPGLDPYFAGPVESALLLNYADIPVVFKYRLGNFKLGAGPYFAFLMSATERFTAEQETGRDVVYKEDVTDRHSGMDLGLVLEASVVATKRRRGGDGLSFHVRFQKGLSDIYEGGTSSGAVRNMGLQIFASIPLVF